MSRPACSRCGLAQAVRPGRLCNKCFAASGGQKDGEGVQPPQTLQIVQVRIDGGTQARVGLDAATVAEYGELYKDGVELPPIDVCFDGSDYWLWDGFHRYFGRKDAGFEDILARVTQGTQREAVLLAVGANAKHALRRTDADKGRAVLILLEDAEWGQRSTDWIKEKAGVSWAFADKVRRQFEQRNGQEAAQPATRECRDGAKRPSRVHKADAGPEQPESDGGAEAEKGPATIPVQKTEGPADAKGRQVPEKLAEAFQASGTFRSLVQQIGRLKAEVLELSKQDGGNFLHVAGIHIDLDNAQRAIRFAAPYVVCPDCGGNKCSSCNGYGWLKEGAWQHLTGEQRQECERHAA